MRTVGSSSPPAPSHNYDLRKTIETHLTHLAQIQPITLSVGRLVSSTARTSTELGGDGAWVSALFRVQTNTAISLTFEFPGSALGSSFCDLDAAAWGSVGRL